MTYAIISPMRSGSTFLFRMLRDFSSDYNIKLNDEFFNTVYPGWSSIDNGERLLKSNREYFPLNEEIEYRINLLKKYNCKNTIKIISTHLNLRIIKFIVKNYDIILLDRENKYDQYLSYILAFHSDVWNKKNNEKHIIPPFVCPIEYALNFFQIEEQWQKDKNYILNISNPIILNYEKLSIDPMQYLEINGINTRKFSIYYEHIHKLNLEFSKEYYIKNINEIKEIFKKRIL
jgi:hypothetical protein